MSDLNRLNELHLTVRSRILEQIQKSLEDGGALAASTQYVKSDGTNYGMYTKSDPASMLNLWDTVINQRQALAIPERIQKPVGPGG